MRPRVLSRLLQIQRVLVRHRLDGIIRATHLFRPLRFAFYLSPATWFPDALRFPALDAVHGYYTALLAHALMFGVGWVAAWVLPRRRGEETAVEAAAG